MRGLKDFKVHSEYRNVDFCFVNLVDLKLDLKEMLERFEYYTDFCKRFRITIDELVKYIKKCCIQDSSLFEFCVFSSNDSYLFAKKAVYKTKQIMVGGQSVTKDISYDVYITHHEYASLSLNNIAKEIVFDKFPFMLNECFCKVVRRFKEDIHNLPKDINTRIDDIDYKVVFNNKLTISDLLHIYADETYMDSLVKKPMFQIYADGSIFMDLDFDSHSLNMKVDDLFNKDWGSIEEHKVSSIMFYDENGVRIPFKWFDGKQKDAPYFKYEKVEIFKKYMLS